MILSPASILASVALVCDLLCTNPSEQPRQQEVVQLSLTREEGLNLGGPGTFALRCPEGWTGLGQVDDLDGDGAIDELVFLADFEPGEIKRVAIGPRTSRRSPELRDSLTVLDTDDLRHKLSSLGQPFVLLKSHPKLDPLALFRLGIYRTEKRKRPILWISAQQDEPSDWRHRCVAFGPIRTVVRFEGFYRLQGRAARPIQIFYAAYAQKPWVECRIRADPHRTDTIQICVGLTPEKEERFYKGGRNGSAMLEEIPFPWCRALILPPLWNRGIVQPTRKRADRVLLLDLDPVGRVVFRAMARAEEGDPTSQWQRWCADVEGEADAFCHPVSVERLPE